MFTTGRNDQHPTHLASLRGTRLVAVTETEEGRAWAESRIKSLTGGDKISARVMRGDPFEFSPVFKLWIAGNHRPVLRNPDPAMRRRMHLMPFTFVPAKPDPKLADALREEQPQILQWAIDGCLAWQRDRLKPPAAVMEATNSYFEEQDSFAAWVAERCERKAIAETPSRAAFADWKRWTGERGEEAGTEKRFSEVLQRHAMKRRTKTSKVLVGLGLLPSRAEHRESFCHGAGCCRVVHFTRYARVCARPRIRARSCGRNSKPGTTRHRSFRVACGDCAQRRLLPIPQCCISSHRARRLPRCWLPAPRPMEGRRR